MAGCSLLENVFGGGKIGSASLWFTIEVGGHLVDKNDSLTTLKNWDYSNPERCGFLFLKRRKKLLTKCLLLKKLIRELTSVTE